MSEKQANPQHETPRQMPGQVLRQAREKAGVEIKAIASQLNLQSDVIAALEADDAGKLPAPTYVRGYIRSYARIMHLDGDSLIRLYDQDAVAPPEIVPDIKQPAQISSTDKPVKAFTYLVTFALALLLVAWLLQSHYKTEEAPAASTNNTAEPDEHTPLPDWTAPRSATDINTPASRLSTYPETVQPSATTAPVESAPAIDPSGLISNIGIPDTGSGMETAAAGELTATQPAAAENSNTNRIDLKISKDSWVEIYDGANTRLYLGLAKAGEEISVTGTAPYNVLLGYSPGVQVTYNGKTFDPEPYSTSGVAKFKLEPASDTAAEEETE